MKKLKKIVSTILSITIALGLFTFTKPITAQAADASFKTGETDGVVYVTKLDPTFKDGKYVMNFNFKYVTSTYIDGLEIQNIRLVDSSGNRVAYWKDRAILKGGGSVDQAFSYDFSKLASGTYYFKFTVYSQYCGRSMNCKFPINHNKQSVKYSSNKYTYDTSGNKMIKVVFATTDLKGYCPKLEIYDSNGKLIRTITTKNALKTDSSNFYFTWNMRDKNGDKVSNGTYKFKFIVNGISACKKLTLTTN